MKSSEQCLALQVSLVPSFRRLSCADQLYPASLVIDANEAIVKFQYLADIYPTTHTLGQTGSKERVR